MKLESDIRNKFRELYESGTYVADKSGQKLLEIIGAQFKVESGLLFGNINMDWAKRELDWYNSMSLSVYDIAEPIPEIWKQVSSDSGKINSNYGWCTFSPENYDQFDKCKNQLLSDIESRRAMLIYTRPSIQDEYNTDNMSDYLCTNTTQFIIRDNKLHHFVYMRSNDAVHGFKGDAYWQMYIHNKMYNELKLKYTDLIMGDLIWNATSLHIYERHFFMVDGFKRTGVANITKAEYDKL